MRQTVRFGGMWLALGCGLLLSLAFAPAPVAQAAVAQAADAPRAAIFETADKWTEGATGAAKLAEHAGFKVSEFDVTKPATEQGADLIILGSFISEDPRYGTYIQKHGASLAKFVDGGGVVLQFTQADQTEARVPFLPEGLKATRNDVDLAPVFVLDVAHPLMKGFLLTRSLPAQWPLPTHFGRSGSWESFNSVRGANVVVAADMQNQYGCLLEMAHGKGRFLLTSLYFDKLYNKDGQLIAPAGFEQTAQKFFGNVKAYTTLVMNEQAPKVEVTPEFKPAEPLAFVDGSFTIAVLPDTQVYAERYPQHFYSQAKWIADNAKARNIKYVLHLGDITNRNTKEQWDVAQKAMFMLDDSVPYAMAPGNHDYGPGGNASNRETFFNEYFPLEKYQKWPSLGGVMEEGHLDNSWHEFSVGDQKFLILALEWGPRDKTVAWANEVVKAHPEHRVILITHAYMYSDETRYNWKERGGEQNWNPHAYGTGKSPEGTNDGEDLYQKLVSKHPNFMMTLNGHVLNDGLGRLSSTTPRGNTVHQMLVNYQMKTEGGQAFMRLMEFLPDGKTVQVKAYSPSVDEYKTDPQNQFVLELDPPLSLKK